MATPVAGECEQLGEEARKLERAGELSQAEADIILAKYELEQAKARREEARRRDAQAGSSGQGAEGAGRGLHAHRARSTRLPVPAGGSRSPAGSPRRTIR